MAKGIFSSVLFSFINTVPVDAKISEIHRLTADPSMFTLEDGTQVSDHVVLKPREVSIQFEVNNQDNYTLANGLQIGSPTSYGLKAAGVYYLLQRLWENRVPFTVVTRHWLYRNMVVKDMTTVHIAPVTGAIVGNLSLVQIPIKPLTNIKRPANTLGPENGIAQKASSIVNSGSQTAFSLANDVPTQEAADGVYGGAQ